MQRMPAAFGRRDPVRGVFQRKAAHCGDPEPAGRGEINIGSWLAPNLIHGSALLYYIPRFIRARRGINVSFVYKSCRPSEAGPGTGPPAEYDVDAACSSYDMAGASMSYDGPGDPVSGATSARCRLCGTTDTGAGLAAP